MMLDRITFGTSIFLCLLISGCSTQKIAVRATSGILLNGMASLYEEEDLLLAEQAIPANIKLLETFLKSDPDNDNLLLMLAEAYTNYAMGFVEDHSPERASAFYLRAKEYGLGVLMKNKTFRKSLEDIQQFQLSLMSFKIEDVPALFWTANPWGNYINLNKDDVHALTDIPKVQSMMERVLELNETFFYGGAHLALGVIWSARSPTLGGNPQKARLHFEVAMAINDQLLMTQYLYARHYAVQVQDRTLFRKLLENIVSVPENILPEQNLANQIARKRAKKLLTQEDDLFL